MQRTLFARSAGWSVLALLVAGCGSEAVPELPKVEAPKVVQQVQQAVVNKIETVKQTVQLVPKFELQINGPLPTGGCYASLVPLGGRPSVLQITSYNDMSNESFPSVFLRGQVAAAAAPQLVNQQIYAEMFVQRQQNGPILTTLPGKPVQVTITAVEGNVIAGELMPGATLVDSHTKAQVVVSGKFNATLKQ